MNVTKEFCVVWSVQVLISQNSQSGLQSVEILIFSWIIGARILLTHTHTHIYKKQWFEFIAVIILNFFKTRFTIYLRQQNAFNRNSRKTPTADTAYANLEKTFLFGL